MRRCGESPDNRPSIQFMRKRLRTSRITRFNPVATPARMKHTVTAMTESDAERVLRDAGADHVVFSEEFPYFKGVGIKACGRHRAVRWASNHDGIAEAVDVLKRWMATLGHSESDGPWALQRG